MSRLIASAIVAGILLVAQTLAAQEDEASPIAPQSMDGFGGIPQRPFASPGASPSNSLVLGEQKMDLRQPTSIPKAEEKQDQSQAPQSKASPKKPMLAKKSSKPKSSSNTAAKAKAKPRAAMAKKTKTTPKSRIPASKKAKTKK